MSEAQLSRKVRALGLTAASLSAPVSGLLYLLIFTLSLFLSSLHHIIIVYIFILKPKFVG